MYEIKIQHDGLHKDRLIRGNDSEVVRKKAVAQIRSWEAEKALADIENILVNVFDKNCELNWEELKDYSVFDKQRPTEPIIENIMELEIGAEPLESDHKYQPKINLLDKLFVFPKKKKINKLMALFKDDHEEYIKTKEVLIGLYNKYHEEADNNYKKEKNDYDNFLNQWDNEKNDFIEAQKAKNEDIDKQMEAYKSHNSGAIVDYSYKILSNSKYPDSFPQEYEIDYIPQTKIMIIDYLLPNIDNVPKLKEVKYIQASDEYKDIYLSDSFLSKIYDNLLYNITLRSLYELFSSDIIRAIDSIIFNGIVRAVDKSNGNEVTNFILSIQANRAEFVDINLSGVDPKACFKKLKGVSASKLCALSAIAPIMKINREDSRFIDAYGVADSLDDSVNIAAMGWQDFEHLVREIFEKVFNEKGGEVKITQTSRDGGVDAIAFDPDTLLGGKIVIQAKRYTNVVGVAAVRDLYGTIHNEGATKGILVTTSEYGPDAYEFAKNKPITLLNGSHLLHLLEKHGHKAKIDLKEAKKILEDEGKR